MSRSNRWPAAPRLVAYRCGGPDGLLAESAATILVDDDREFLSAVESLLADESPRAQMGVAGRRYEVDNLTAQDFLADQLLFTLER